MARRSHAFAVAALVAVTLVGGRGADAHVVLDGEIARPILVDLARDLRDTREGGSDAARLEALFLVGERVHQLVELMNLDLLAHGRSLFGELLIRRLAEHGVRVDFIERNGRYVSDLAPFEEYLRRSPRGPRAADAKFRVVAEMFHRSTGRRPEEIADGGVEELRDAVARKEAFLRDHPGHDRVRDVRFFLAMDYYRLFRNSTETATRGKYEQLARRALQQIMHEFPETAEARSAEITLKALAGGIP
ncbi:MAG: tetratricopeptide repeat protein [Thermoanaerobaculia bacterium]